MNDHDTSHAAATAGSDRLFAFSRIGFAMRPPSGSDMNAYARAAAREAGS